MQNLTSTNKRSPAQVSAALANLGPVGTPAVVPQKKKRGALAVIARWHHK